MNVFCFFVFFPLPRVRRYVLPSLGPPVKVSRRVSCTIDGLDLKSNCEAYAHTAALTNSVGLHPNAGLSLMLSDVQTYGSVQIKYMGFKWAGLTHNELTAAWCHFDPNAPVHNVYFHGSIS